MLTGRPAGRELVVESPMKSTPLRLARAETHRPNGVATLADRGDTPSIQRMFSDDSQDKHVKFGKHVGSSNMVNILQT